MEKEILKLTGAVIAIGEMQSGTSKKGTDWTSQEIVIKPEGKWEKAAAFRQYKPEKDLNEDYKLKDFVEIKFSVASREYKGKWYTNLDAWAINKLSDSREELKFDGDKDKEGTTNNIPPPAGEDRGDLPF